MITFRIILTACVTFILFWAPIAFAQSASPLEKDRNLIENKDRNYTFIKKRYSIYGSAHIIKSGSETQIMFDDGFRTKGGPDLKVYLSKKSIAELENTSVDTHSVKIGVLKSKKGQQSYVIPDDISLSDYKSVIIHCEAFSILWGGFDL